MTKQSEQMTLPEVPDRNKRVKVWKARISGEIVVPWPDKGAGIVASYQQAKDAADALRALCVEHKIHGVVIHDPEEGTVSADTLEDPEPASDD